MSVSVTIVRNEIGVTTIPDVGPTVTVAPGTVAVNPLVGVSDHAALVNLTGGDPHTQYVLKAGATMVGALNFVSVTGLSVNDEAGDSLAYNTNRAPLRWGLARGTAGSPITTAGAPLKISKTEQIADGVLTNGAASDENAALSVFSKGLASTQVQAAAIHAFATSASTQSTFNDDSTALIGVGRVEGSGATGFGVGGYFEGYVGSGTAGSAGAIGTELRSGNFTGSDHTYNSAGASKSMGLWLTPNGDAANRKSGAAIGIGKLANGLWDVGIGAVASSIANTFLRDDSSATASILINGTHTKALAIASGAGYVVVGGTAVVNASSLLEVLGPDAAADPLVVFGNASFARPYSVRLGASTGTSVWFISNTTNQFLTGTAQGDVGMSIPTSGKKMHFGGTTSVIAVTQSNQLGFFQHATAAQQTGGANVTNNVTSGGTNDTIDNWTSLTTYSTDAAAIRNAMYQLARLVKQDHDALRAFGLLS